MRWIVSLFLFSSCIPNNSLETMSLSRQNVENMIRISSGMSTEEVIQIMHPPHRIETLQIGEDSYEAWFYLTRGTALAQGKLLSKNMTPLVFKDGILMGRGYDYYRWVLRNLENYNLEQKANLHPKKEPVEDRSLEKSLDITMTKAQPKPEEPPPEPPKDDVPLTPEDDDFLDQESDQNFDYW